MSLSLNRRRRSEPHKSAKFLEEVKPSPNYGSECCFSVFQLIRLFSAKAPIKVGRCLNIGGPCLRGTSRGWNSCDCFKICRTLSHKTTLPCLTTSHRRQFFHTAVTDSVGRQQMLVSARFHARVEQKFSVVLSFLRPLHDAIPTNTRDSNIRCEHWSCQVETHRIKMFIDRIWFVLYVHYTYS